jgi:hypothetical protein
MDKNLLKSILVGNSKKENQLKWAKICWNPLLGGNSGQKGCWNGSFGAIWGKSFAEMDHLGQFGAKVLLKWTIQGKSGQKWAILGNSGQKYCWNQRNSAEMDRIFAEIYNSGQIWTQMLLKSSKFNEILWISMDFSGFP